MKVGQITDDAVSYFLKRVNSISEDGPWRKTRRIRNTFSMLRFANDEFYEYAYFERTLEWYIRDLLINRILRDLFQIHGIDSRWPKGKKYINYRTELLEHINPFEFIVVEKEGKTGVRYTELESSEVNDVVDKYGIARIVQVKWSNDVVEQNCSKYEIISPKTFFCRYFSLEEYEIFISKVLPAVEIANAEIGFETIPRLSLRYLSNFKGVVDEELRNTIYEAMRFQVLPQTSDRKSLSEQFFDERDYAILNRRYIEERRYKALLGSEGFAKCFITAEYQYQVFKQGHSFDYTSVACGYLKSVEQLIYKLLLTNLECPSTEKLWIKKNGKDIPSSLCMYGVTCRKNPETNKCQVAFEPEYQKYFDITLSAMVWFLYDNLNGWEISSQGRIIVRDFLLNFAKECRNDHFHKDNISEFEVVSRIRNNAILILYVLLGGYKLTEDNRRDLQMLGVIDDSFERLYKSVRKIPSGICKFVLYYRGKEPVKVYRLFEQDQTIYDENGSVASSVIKLVAVDHFARDEYDKAMQGEYSDREFALTSNEMPEQLSYINGRDEEVFVKW